ncbi:MAG: NAD(P)H-hydrate dehydratase [Verrucomicrobiota bacterium]
MMKAFSFAHPILTSSSAKSYESSLLEDEADEWKAISAAGAGMAKALLLDYSEIRPVPDNIRVLALIGKGHNGGDALIACHELLAVYPRAKISVLLASNKDAMRPLTKRALDQVEGRVEAQTIPNDASKNALLELLQERAGGEAFDICIDGLLGMSSSGAPRAPISDLISAINEFEAIDLRAAVDLPSGVNDATSDLFFRADFCYCTGIPKHSVFHSHVPYGRVRYLDLGFFEGNSSAPAETQAYVLTSSTLDSLRRLRPASVDKRKFGHLYVVGGSAFMPGALLMSVQAAVRSGVGLVTAFAPASVAATLAAQVPEAMWIAWPETSNGTLDPRAMPLLLDRLENRATAVLCGPGMGQDRNTELVAQNIVRNVEQPVLLDADALRPKIIEQAPRRKAEWGPVVVTPHVGEYRRMSKASSSDLSNKTLCDFCKTYRLTTILKAPLTRICDGESVFYNTYGGPVLSRGGSGDILAGLVGGMLAHGSLPVVERIANGILLHGLAAQYLARDSGQVTVQTTQILDYLPQVLRSRID